MPNKIIEKIKGRPRWQYAVGGLVVILAASYFLMPGAKVETGTTFAARKGDLPIKVLEGGSIEALESQEIRSEVKGHQGTKILSIVEEGYQVTEDDVRTNKVLVELDSSEIQQRVVTQDIQFQSTLASLTEAKEAFEIQENQNKSDIKTAEQKARFALMDLEKYLGDVATVEVLKEAGLENLVKEAWTELADPDLGLPVIVENAARRPKSTNINDTMESTGFMAPVDFSKYAKSELLGDGAAKQNLRKLEDDLLVAQSELNLAQTKLAGTRRLFEKQFVTKNELDNEEITVKKSALKVETGRTALDLFIKYEFSKASEEFLSKYEEALRLLVRARKEAISRYAQSRAKLKSAEGRFKIEDKQTAELKEQLEKCVITAKKTGLVVYGGGNDRGFYYGEEQIREGATVRERQPIITIPDMTQMSVNVKIHESYIKKVAKGLKAVVRVDSFPDQALTGEVTKVGVLPDSQNRWLNPDLKVYVTSVNIVGVHDWLKPGMSARVEILVKELDEVIYVPLQAVTPHKGKHICYLPNGGNPETREVVVGEFNDEFIEIKSGLKAGELVMLHVPESMREEEGEAAMEEKPADQPQSPTPAAPVAQVTQ